MSLPTPRLTATLLPLPIGAPRAQMREVVIHGSPGWRDRVDVVPASDFGVGRRSHCTACREHGHNARTCPARRNP